MRLYVFQLSFYAFLPSPSRDVSNWDLWFLLDTVVFRQLPPYMWPLSLLLRCLLIINYSFFSALDSSLVLVVSQLWNAHFSRICISRAVKCTITDLSVTQRPDTCFMGQEFCLLLQLGFSSVVCQFFCVVGAAGARFSSSLLRQRPFLPGSAWSLKVAQ